MELELELWVTSVMVVIVPMSWSKTVSIGIMMTWTVVSVKLCLGPWMASPIPVLIALSGNWSGVVTFVQSGLVMLCWGSQKRNLTWAIHYNVTLLITFKTPNVRAIPCYVAMFLALETSVLIIWHHVDCRWWSDCGSQLLYSIKLFNFGYCIVEGLWFVSYMWVAKLWAFLNPWWIFWLELHYWWSYTF